MKDISLGLLSVPPGFPIFWEPGAFSNEFPKSSRVRVPSPLFVINKYQFPPSSIAPIPTGTFKFPILPKFIPEGAEEKSTPKLSREILLLLELTVYPYQLPPCAKTYKSVG